MIYSMTGFGRGIAQNEKYKITAELKSVNHKYLDINVKLPHRLAGFENEIRGIVKNHAARGKIDVFIGVEVFGAGDRAVRYNSELAKEYFDIFTQIKTELGLSDEISLKDVASMPEVVTVCEADGEDEEIASLLKESVSAAAVLFAKHRADEGERLSGDILLKLDEMRKSVDEIEKASPLVIEKYKEKLSEKIKEYLGNVEIDENRILTEVAVFADKTCVDEETVRLKSHIESMKEALLCDAAEPVGKKLDFIAQEMNREANTTLSKSGDIGISQVAVLLKTTIEKIREQVQNIE